MINIIFISNKKQEGPNTFKRVLSTIGDLLPPGGYMKPGLDSMAGIELITNEKLSKKEQLMKALSKIPRINYSNKGWKIRKNLSVINKIGKEAKASKEIKIDEKRINKSKNWKEKNNNWHSSP